MQSGTHTRVHTHVSADRRDIHTQSVPWHPLQCPPGPHAEACPRACDHSMHAPDQLALPTDVYSSSLSRVKATRQWSGWAQSSSLGEQTRSRAPQPESGGPGGRISWPISRGS